MKRFFWVVTFFLLFFVIFKFPFHPFQLDGYEHVNTRLFRTVAICINHKNTFWGITNILGNTLPFFIWAGVMKRAFLLPCIPCFFLASCLIVLFEIVQYVTKLGTCDIDDVLLNSLSVMIGIMLVNFFAKRKLD